MKIILNKDENVEYRTGVALGNFDGIHIGHKHLISTMKSKSVERNLVPAVFTFNNNCTQMKTKNKCNTLISDKQKAEIIDDLGVDVLYMVNFDDEFRRMTPEDFIRDIIVKKLNAKLVVVGFDFRFGYKAEGDSNYLMQAASKYGFECLVIEPITNNKQVISSTHIRDLIKNGDIREANLLLGRPYTMRGTVIGGKGRGKGLGFATANIDCEIDYLPPKFGVYKTYTVYKGKEYLSITNVGRNPTFEDIIFSIETHILDFDMDIYGEQIQIKFIEFIRDEKKFDNVQALISQVISDIDTVRVNK
ncbi:riboflavin biosynthesis protein RibC [Gottschalkia purinilytica]|uniref:Riboflavin biosynthesis protein n=1 Tax=Gottschalkia purinilytica TaxID=1503 RepID=A0A0L0WBL1_GOTPU|nr:bifunctional riboflavin kinase/FAD synthetase [Gottschalkia purinilytica]KNF08866.1 riboflavin biosynthesis protein RibC [Gottschalkia purinilytica]